MVSRKEELRHMPRKGENIYKRKDGRWEGRYPRERTDAGKIVYGYVYAKTYREVREKLREKASSHYAKTTAQDSADSNVFSVIADDWYENIKLQIRESTRNKYQNMLTSYILPFYADLRLDQITYDVIEGHCRQLLSTGGKRGTGLSAKTVTDVLSVVRNIFKFAIKKGMNVPCDGSAIQVKSNTKPMRILSKKEQERLCRYVLSNPDPYNIGILLCLFTGVRVGELCALRWEDISFTEQTLHVSRTLQRVQNKSEKGAKTKIVITTPKSACSIRIIPLPEELSRILIVYKQTAEGYLLTNDEIRFVEPRMMQNRFKNVLKLCNIAPANFHALRHTFATRCVELGFEIKSLSEILGHATVNITMNRYVHPTFEMKQENMQKLSHLLTVK